MYLLYGVAQRWVPLNSRVVAILWDAVEDAVEDADSRRWPLTSSRFAPSYPVPHVTVFFPFDCDWEPLPQSGLDGLEGDDG